MNLKYKICALQFTAGLIISFFWGLVPMLTFGAGCIFMLIADYFYCKELVDTIYDQIKKMNNDMFERIRSAFVEDCKIKIDAIKGKDDK